MITVKPDLGNKKVLLEIAGMAEETRASIRWGFFELARDLKNTANDDILRKPKRGHTYVVRGPSGRRRRHKASAPGESHANLTGKTRKSITWSVRGANEMQFGYGVTREATPWGKFLEFGTKKMAARPSLQNSINKNLRNAEVHFQRQIQRRFAV